MKIFYAFLLVIVIVENIIFLYILRQRKALLKQNYLYAEKLHIFFDLLSEWFVGKIKGKNIADWIIKNNYKRIAIYGMGSLGEVLYLDLCDNQNIHILYGLDRKEKKIKDLKIYSLADSLVPVDLIIVTAVTSYEEIKKEIAQRMGFSCKIISLAQLIEEMYIVDKV